MEDSENICPLSRRQARQTDRQFFYQLKKFVILEPNKDALFKWLQSVDDPALAFPVISVASLEFDYTIDLPDSTVDALGIKNVESVLVMNITSIPQDNPKGTTINLLAPLIFNVDNKVDNFSYSLF